MKAVLSTWYLAKHFCAAILQSVSRIIVDNHWGNTSALDTKY